MKKVIVYSLLICYIWINKNIDSEEFIGKLKSINDKAGDIPGFGKVSDKLAAGLSIAHDFATFNKVTPDPENELSEKEKYITDQQGNRIGVLLDIKEYQQLLEQLEELEAIQAYDNAILLDEEEIPFEVAIAEIENSRQ